MKYWRGYLTAGILAVITWALTQFAARFSTLVDMVYPYLTRTIQTFLADWTAGAPFCMWQMAVVLLVAILLATIVLMIIFRWNFVQWLGWVLAAVMSLGFFHTGMYGLNYYAGPLTDDLRMTVYQYTLEDLQEATIYYRDKANALALQIPRAENGDLLYDSFEDLADKAGNGFKKLTYEEGYSVFAGSYAPVKKLGWSDLYTSMGITGITMGMTGEAAVNPQIPSVSLPFTMSHEMSHRMCIAHERDANFAAFLACRISDDIQFQYSAYFMAYRYCISALQSVNDTGAAVAAARIDSGVNEHFAHDIRQYNEFFSKNQNKTATNFASIVNDTYLKTSGEESGVTSYGEVCNLLVNLYIEEIVMPEHVQDAENAFDPYDENQVDISGIVGALPGGRP